jgi:hypothetical protein
MYTNKQVHRNVDKWKGVRKKSRGRKRGKEERKKGEEEGKKGREGEVEKNPTHRTI